MMYQISTLTISPFFEPFDGNQSRDGDNAVWQVSIDGANVSDHMEPIGPGQGDICQYACDWCGSSEGQGLIAVRKVDSKILWFGDPKDFLDQDGAFESYDPSANGDPPGFDPLIIYVFDGSEYQASIARALNQTLELMNSYVRSSGALKYDFTPHLNSLKSQSIADLPPFTMQDAQAFLVRGLSIEEVRKFSSAEHRNPLHAVVNFLECRQPR